MPKVNMEKSLNQWWWGQTFAHLNASQYQKSAAMALFNMAPLTWSLGQTHKGAMTWNEALASSLCLLGMIFLVLQHKAAPQAQVRMIL